MFGRAFTPRLTFEMGFFFFVVFSRSRFDTQTAAILTQVAFFGCVRKNKAGIKTNNPGVVL